MGRRQDLERTAARRRDRGGTNQLFAWMTVSPDGSRLDLIYYDLGYDPAGYLIDVTYAAR